MLTIDAKRADLLVLAGRLDASQCGPAQAALDAAHGVVTLDCSGLEYISSAGLGVLLKTQKRLLAAPAMAVVMIAIASQARNTRPRWAMHQCVSFSTM